MVDVIQIGKIWKSIHWFDKNKASFQSNVYICQYQLSLLDQNGMDSLIYTFFDMWS